MATLENIRKRGPLIAIVIGFALFAFILGDLFTRGTSFFKSSQRDIAYIDGEAVTIEEFQQLYNEWEEIYKIQTGSTTIDQNTQKEIQNQVWEELQRKYILNPRFEVEGINVSDLELAEMVRGQNIEADPTIRQYFTDPQTGIYNSAAAINFFTNIDQSPEYQKLGLYLEKQMRENKKYSKYESLIAKGLNVTNFEAKLLYKERVEVVDVQHVAKNYDKIADNKVSVSKKEIEAYYEEHKNEFEQEESRDIAYVTFDIVPSKDDYDLAREEIESFKKEFSEISIDTVDNIINFVNANSQNRFNYVHLTKEQLNDSVLFNMPLGSVSGPVLKDGFYQLRRITSVKMVPDSVQASHILIQPDGKKIADMKAAKSLADSVKTLIENGGDFEKLAIEFSADQNTNTKGGDIGKFVEGRYGKLLDDVFFGSKTGDLKVVEAQYGYHVIKITWQSNFTKKVQVAILDKEVVPQKETVSEYFAKARNFAAASSNSVEKFDAECEKNKYTKKVALDLLPSTEVIAGVENAGQIINWAFNEDTEKGTVSEAYQGVNNFVVAIVTKVKEKGIAPVEQVSDIITEKVKIDKKGDIIAQEMKKAFGSSADFAAVAAKIGGTSSEIKNLSFSANRIQDLGNEPVISGTAFSLAKGKLSEPLKGVAGVYMIKVTSITGVGDMKDIDVTNDKRNGEGRIMFKTRDLYRLVKKTAEVEDLRYKFF